MHWKKAPLISAWVLAISTDRGWTNPPFIPEPDPALVAAVDVQTNRLQEGMVRGDFEPWYPGLYHGYSWEREVTEIGSNGLFQVDYKVFQARGRHREAASAWSVLLFRPESAAGRVSLGLAAPGPEVTARRPSPAPPRPTEATRAAALIEGVLVASRIFEANAELYRFVGDSQSVSVVARLPDSFPGAESFGGLEMRRVRFFLQPGRHGQAGLYVEHAPPLLDARQTRPYVAKVAEEVSLFHLEYWDAGSNRWLEEWNSTNGLPRLVRVTLGLGRMPDRSGAPRELVSRLVALPANPVPVGLSSWLPGLPPGGTDPTPPDWPKPTIPPAGIAVPSKQFESWIRSQAFPRALAKPPTIRERSHDQALEWLGRSGVELARYVLMMEFKTDHPDALTAKWAGGQGEANSPVANIPLENFQLGRGSLSVRICDQDRKWNINLNTERFESMVPMGLWLMGVELSGLYPLNAAILDWCDPDSTERPYGAESDYYLELSPPYFAKNGLIDDLSELLLIKGMAPYVLGGGNSGAGGSLGFADIFTTVSSGFLNINTASAPALQIIPEVDVSLANAIVATRAGPDGVEGSADDMPFRSLGELGRVPGLSPLLMPGLQMLVNVRSLVFEVRVEARLGKENRHFQALIWRKSGSEIEVLSFSPE